MNHALSDPAGPWKGTSLIAGGTALIWICPRCHAPSYEWVSWCNPHAQPVEGDAS